MSGGEPVDYSQIVGPAAPPEEADQLTKKGIAQLKKAAKLPTPSERLDASVAHHLDDLKVERDRLIDECRVARERYFSLHDEMIARTDDLSTLKQQFHDTRAAFGFSALAQAIGAVLVSVAGTTADLFWKPLCLWTGVTSFVIGFLLGGWSMMLIGRDHTRSARSTPQLPPREPGA